MRGPSVPGPHGEETLSPVNDETTRVVIAAALVLNVLLILAGIAVLLVRRAGVSGGSAGLAASRSAPVFGDSLATDGIALLDWLSDVAPRQHEPTYDRVFRIASWTFLLVSVASVAMSGLWAARLPAIVTLVAVAGVFVLLVHDVLPSGSVRAVRTIVQAFVAIGFASLLVFLTGGFESPFLFTFPLVVGGAALVLPPLAALGLAFFAAPAYLGSASLGGTPPTSLQVVTTAINLTGILLLTYIGSAVGREQHRAREAALRMSAIDSLTGLYNRTFLFAAVAREIARSERSGRGFCLAMLDLDDLKEINDRNGHHAGDAVLRAVADTLRATVRRIDVAARYGGDEFVALLPETDPTGGWVVAEKIRLAMRERAIAGLSFHPTISLGVVSYPTDGRTADGLLLSADRAMYVAKRGGKDRVASPATEPTVIPIESGRVARGGERTG
jgi:diguanylate cyclase (GGDEF)-like protein